MNPNMSAPTPGAGAPRSGAGFVVATIIILAVILAGAVYFWKARSASAPAANDAALNQIQNQSAADDAASINADLNSTNVDNADYDLTPSNFTSS